MPLADDFENAQTRVKTLHETPDNDELLALYALYKQATVGDVDGKRPGMLGIRGRAKYDAWAKKSGTSKDAAMQAYVTLVQKLVQTHG